MSEALAESAGTTGAAVIDPTPIQPPAPISSTPQPAEQQEQAKEPISVRESIKAAREKIEAAEKQPKVSEKAAEKQGEVKSETKPVEKEPDNRREEPAGKPVERRQEPGQQQDTTQQRAAHSTAPQRFSEDAKAAWETSPEPVKAEVHRAIRELEEGHKKYREAAEAYEPLREYDKLTKQHGTTVKEAMDRYTGMERLLTSNDPQEKANAIAEVLRYAGVTPQQYAAFITGMKPDEVQSQNDATINTLRRQVEQLQQQIGGVTTTIKEQKETALLNSVSKFAEDKPRFNELSGTIAKLISTGMADDVAEAYEMADRLNPGSAPVRQERQPVTTDPAAHTRGEKSITGAPSAGSNPDLTKPKTNPSIKEAIRAARAQVG